MSKWFFLIAFVACTACDIKSNPPTPVTGQPQQPVNPGSNLGEIDKASYTHTNPTGNRVVTGSGSILETFLDIELSGKPQWLTAISSTDFAYYVVALENGRIEAFILRPDRVVIPVGMNIEVLPKGTPPTLALESNERPVIVNATEEEFASTSSPIVLSSGEVVQLGQNGDLVRNPRKERQNFAVNALPDARIVLNSLDELAVLTDPTSDYQHGVLGDAIEARSITIVTTDPEFAILNTIVPGGQSVIEGVSPIWADIDEDGEEDLLVTVSNNEEGDGAKLVAYRKNGDTIAEGPLSPGGWRHQLAVYKPASSGPQYIVDVQKPHVQQILNFYQLVGDKLEIVASKPGYSTHQLGSRNLDQALAGNFDGVGLTEILVPSANGFEIRSVVLKDGEVLEQNILAPGGKIATNFASTTLDGQLTVAVGSENAVLRIWID